MAVHNHVGGDGDVGQVEVTGEVLDRNPKRILFGTKIVFGNADPGRERSIPLPQKRPLK